MDRVCGHLESLNRGRYLLFNNLWGAATGAGAQCLSAEPIDDPDAPIAWETSWQWTGDPDTVKSYAAAVLGWHFGWPGPASPLPVELAAVAALPARWSFELEHGPESRLNVSYDIWLARTPEAEGPDLTDEVMIWLVRQGGPTPIGGVSRTVEVGGARWELWEGRHPSGAWAVHSFVRLENASATAIDLLEFFAAIAEAMPEAGYVVGVQAGTEVFTGSGSLRTTAYSVEVIRTRP